MVNTLTQKDAGVCSRFASIHFSFRQVVVVITVVLLGLLAFQMWVFRNAAADDAYITFRYASNIAGGYGVTFNPGEAPIEGTTTLLWAFLLALWGQLLDYGLPMQNHFRNQLL